MASASDLERFSRVEFAKNTELPCTRSMTQLAERFGFKLADALAGEGERLCDFFERMQFAVLQPESHPDYFLLTRRECFQHRRYLFLEAQVNDRVRG